MDERRRTTLEKVAAEDSREPTPKHFNFGYALRLSALALGQKHNLQHFSLMDRPGRRLSLSYR